MKLSMVARIQWVPLSTGTGTVSLLPTSPSGPPPPSAGAGHKPDAPSPQPLCAVEFIVAASSTSVLH